MRSREHRSPPDRVRADRFRNVEFGGPLAPGETQRSFLAAKILPHPQGCPARAFCGCGAPAPGMVAARRGHVFVIKEVLGNGQVLAFDANSGKRLTRLHVRSLAGFTVVNPYG